MLVRWRLSWQKNACCKKPNDWKREEENLLMSLLASIKDCLKGNVAVLMGGCSAEREISLQSGQAVLDVFLQAGVEVQAIDPAKVNLVNELIAKNIKHVFIALHGRGGEDGSLQGCLEQMAISYTGSGVLASALAMDKLKTKQLWKSAGLETADYAALNPHSEWQAILNELGETVMVKPASEGSSIGMAKAVGAEQLAQAYENAAQYDELVIAERWIDGDEYTVAFVGSDCMPVIKMETDNVFYDYEAKYISDDTRYLCPCGLSEEKELEFQMLAKNAYLSLGCKGWGRVDLMTDASGKPFLLEANTVPGMTSHSLVPMAAKSKGYSFSDLVLMIFKISLDEQRANQPAAGRYSSTLNCMGN